jgi:hypothetical protein
MPTFVLRDIDPDLWRRVEQRLKAEGQRIRPVALRLFELYARCGLRRLEDTAESTEPPPAA